MAEKAERQSERRSLFVRFAIEQVSVAPAEGKLPNGDEEDHQHSGGEQTRFRSIAAAAPEIPGFPYQPVARHSNCKAAEVHAEKRQCGIPAEMNANGQPQVVRTQESRAK